MGVAARESAWDEERPVRLLARYLGQYLFESADRWIELTGGDALDTLLVRTVFGSNLAHLPYRDGETWHGLSTAGSERPVTINAVAQSLGLPFETVRLRIKGLRDNGILDRAARGIVALSAVRGHPYFPALIAREAASLRALLGSIASDAYDPERQMTAGAAALAAIPRMSSPGWSSTWGCAAPSASSRSTAASRRGSSPPRWFPPTSGTSPRTRR